MRHDQPSSLIRHLQVLRAVNEAVSRSLDLNEVLQRSLAALTHVTDHEISSLHLISADGNSLLLRGDRGLSDELRRVNVELPMGEGLIGRWR
jgi:signal transduction protein with GAF and PtsI domain